MTRDPAFGSLPAPRESEGRRLTRNADGSWRSKAGTHLTISVDDRLRISLSAGMTLTVDEARHLADHLNWVANQIAGGWIVAGSRGV